MSKVHHGLVTFPADGEVCCCFPVGELEGVITLVAPAQACRPAVQQTSSISSKHAVDTAAAGCDIHNPPCVFLWLAGTLYNFT